MSIIQEALKKAQSDIKPAARETAKAPVAGKASSAVKRLPLADKKALMAVMLLALMAFAVFSAGRFLRKTDHGTSAADSQVVSYKPLIGSQSENPAALKTPESPKLVLNGIMYLEDGPRAIINNLIVGLGDTVSAAKITAINRQSVVLEYENVEITLSLK